MVHFGEFLKTWSLWSNSVTRQVIFNRSKIDGKCQNSNATFWVIFKHFYLKDLHRIFSGFRVAPKSSFAARWPSEWDWKRPEWIMPRPSRHPCISGKWIASRHNLYSRWIVTCLRPICPSHREERPSPKGLWLQWYYRPSHYPKKESQKTDTEYRWFIIIH